MSLFWNKLIVQPSLVVGEPKSRILQNDKKIAPDFDMAEFLNIGSLNSAWYGTTV